MAWHLATKLRGRIKQKPPQTPRSASNPYRDKMPEPAGPEEPDQPNPAEIPVCSVFPQGLGELAQARTTCSTNGSAPPTVSISMSPLLHTTGFRPGDDWLSSHRGISDYSTCLPCILVEQDPPLSCCVSHHWTMTCARSKRSFYMVYPPPP